MLDQAFEALRSFDFGTPISEIQAIEDAIVSAHTDAALRRDLETRFIAALQSDMSRDAKDYACRKLAMIGTAASVPVLASLLSIDENHHLARHALERIPDSEAGAALATAAKNLQGDLQIGAIGSLGARGDGSQVDTLANLLKASDAGVVRAAAIALGAIGGGDAAQALQAELASSSGDKVALVDGLLSCAESLLSKHQPAEAAEIYWSLSGDDQPRLIRLAATRGLLACASA